MKRFHLNGVWPVAALSACCAALRLIHLRALPTFNDEAIFLRGARILRSDPLHQIWISLAERTPPLHTWLLALCLPLSDDPVCAGRLLSVVASVLTVPALYALFRALDPTFSRSAALFTCTLFVFSPLFSLHQRMARVEAFFVLEMTVVALLALRLGCAARDGTPVLGWGLALGAAMGVTMLTRQGVSYVLWALPLAAWLLAPRGSTQRFGRGAGRLAGALAVSLVLAVAIWLPMLLAKAGPSLSTRILPIEAVHERLSSESWTRIAVRNAADSVSWLWLYLTPPVFVLVIAALVWAARSGRGRVAVILAVWAGLSLLPALPFSNAFFPRYVVPAAVPLLVAGGLGWIALTGWTGRVGTVLLAAAVLAWPARDTVRQLTDWRAQTLAPVDRWQFVSGWPAGFAAEEAARFIKNLASTQRTIVVTSPDSGNPTDTLWLMLQDRPGIDLGSARSLDQPILETLALTPGVLRVFGDLRLGSPQRDIPVTSSTPILYVSPEILLMRNGTETPEAHWRRFHPSFRRVARFSNPPSPDGKPGDAVGVYRIDAE
jgi:hypothetical protein